MCVGGGGVSMCGVCGGGGDILVRYIKGKGHLCLIMHNNAI